MSSSNTYVFMRWRCSNSGTAGSRLPPFQYQSWAYSIHIPLHKELPFSHEHCLNTIVLEEWRVHCFFSVFRNKKGTPQLYFLSLQISVSLILSSAALLLNFTCLAFVIFFKDSFIFTSRAFRFPSTVFLHLWCNREWKYEF